MLNGTLRMAIEGGVKYTTGTFHQGRHSCYFSYSSGSKVRVCAGGQHMPHFPVLVFQKNCTIFFNSLSWLGTSQTPFFFWQVITRLLLWSFLSQWTRKNSLLGKPRFSLFGVINKMWFCLRAGSFRWCIIVLWWSCVSPCADATRG